MKITVTTIYEGVSENEAEEWANRIFDIHWAAQELGPVMVKVMKKTFLTGEGVKASTTNPTNENQTATSYWKLDK